ncbi:hypothetical protein C8Q79DRAFT_89843 [Trametes meyenii]|nr:hypothetical protein C8Q79DRAFT_89843 [Trametes meyenii]
MLSPEPLLADLSSAHASSSSSSSARSIPRTPKRAPRLSPKPDSPHSSLPDPSSGILALLVTVAGSSSADARPLDSEAPPDFLCPRLHAWSLPQSSAGSSSPQPSPSWYWEPCDAVEAATFVDRSVRRRKRRKRVSHSSGNIADKYIKGPDGRWRKADSWELYGSSSCSSQCMETPEATEFPVQDDQVSASTGTVTATSSSTSSPSLPPGWDKDKDDDTMTGMILALSLSLAVVLIIFMMGIVRWRQKRRIKREKDAESIPSARDGANLEESEEMKRARAQQRLWARASAKWISNVRQSARRRRKRMAPPTAKDSDGRTMREAQASSSAVSLSRIPSILNNDQRSSRSSSRHTSRSSSSSSRSPSPASSDQRRTSGAPSSSNHPPAYLQTSSSTFQHAYSRWRSHPLDSAQDSHQATDIPPPDSPPPCSADRSPPPPLSPLPYEGPVHSAHVAVDDKALLARMARLASAPPPTASEPSTPAPPGGSSDLRPSVPLLEDDPFEDVPLDIEFDNGPLHTDRRPGLLTTAHDARPVPPHGHSSHSLSLAPQLRPAMPVSMHGLDAIDPEDGEGDGEVPSYAEDVLHHRPFVLPSPPAKVPLQGPMFYEYPDEFERDVETVEPVTEPSAPPFEEPSSPPLEYAELDASEIHHVQSHMIAPSAPPLDYADEASPTSEGLLPSAPPLDMHADEDQAEGMSPNGGIAPSAPLSRSADDQGNVTPGDANSNPSARVRDEARSPRVAGEPEGQSETAPPQYLP